MTTLRRAFVRFHNDPSSLRYATAAIASTIAFLVLIGSVFVWVSDRNDYPTFGSALWFTLQTVTTVGYGDNPPTTALGQIVASVVMLVSIALFTVVTAVVTSIFIRALGRDEQHPEQQLHTESLARIEAALAAVHARLDTLESSSPGSTERPDH